MPLVLGRSTVDTLTNGRGKTEEIKSRNGALAVTTDAILPTNNTGTIADGTAIVVSMAGIPVPRSVSVTADTGTTITVSYSIDGTNYFEWDDGAVIATTIDARLIAPLHSLKFQRTSGSGTTSTYTII